MRILRTETIVNILIDVLALKLRLIIIKQTLLQIVVVLKSRRAKVKHEEV